MWRVEPPATLFRYNILGVTLQTPARRYRRIYAPSEDESSPNTFAILTTEANDVMRPVHDRMPVILPLGREKEWLPTGGVTFFNPFPAELMTAYPVTPKMNNARFNTPEASAPLEASIT